MIRLRVGSEELELSWDEWEERVAAGRVPPDALVCFAPVTGEGSKPAADLEIYTSLHDEERLRWQAALVRGGAPLVTAVLVGVQIRIWWFARWPEVAQFVSTDLTNASGPVLENGEVWRLLTMGFVHLDVAHIGLNLLWLGYCGWNLERALGRVNLVAIYLFAVLCGALLSCFLAPETASLGASGGVFGLICAAVAFGLTRPHLLPDRARQYLGVAMLPYLLLMFGSGLTSRQIDNLAHFGGLVGGGVLSVLLDPPRLERRPGHNRLVLGITGGASVLLLAVLALFGPRLYPIEDHQDALQRQHTITGPELPASTELVSNERDRELRFDVPAGWKRNATLANELGFVSMAGERAWSVREWQAGAPTTIDELRARWEGKLLRRFPEATTTEPVRQDLAAWPGWAARTELVHEGEPMVLEWRVAIRGRWVLEEVWQVEQAEEHRLQPLVDRLRTTVHWPDPEPLRKARLELDRTPRSRKVRREHAQALTDVGEAREAMRAWRTLLVEQPEDQEAWEGVLRTARWYPEVVEDMDELWDEALTAVPTPDTTVRVVRALEDADAQALGKGLLEVAWLHWPGDRTIRRARRARDLSVSLDVERYLPPEWLYDPVAGRPLDEAEVEALRQVPLTLDGARTLSAERDRRESALNARVLASLASGEQAAAVDDLLLLLLGSPPEDPVAARARLREELELLAEGRERRWIPEPLEEPLTSAAPALLDALS